jgi:anti-sigma factor RsiW
MVELERGRQLLMAYLDGEISEIESRELDSALAGSLELRRELDSLEQLNRRLAGIRIQDPADKVLAELEKTFTSKVAMPLGWLILIAGILVFMTWAGISWVTDPKLSLVTRLSGVSIFLGFLILFLVKVRERWIENSHDLYRDIVR